MDPDKKQKKPTIKELEEICLKPKEDILSFLPKKVSIRITRLLINTKITPNQITFISLILGIASAPFFFLGTYPQLIIGAALFYASFILDLVDGELARCKKKYSDFGVWLDMTFDSFNNSLIVLVSAIGLFFNTNNSTILIIGLIAFFNIYIRYYLGGVGFFIHFFPIAALFNKIYYALLFYATIGAIVWIKQMFAYYKRFH